MPGCARAGAGAPERPVTGRTRAGEGALEVRVATGGAFAQNGYLVRDPASGRALLVDPGGGTPELLASLARSGEHLEAVVLTHAHIDHLDGIPAVREAWPGVPILLHEADRPLYDDAVGQAALFGLRLPPLPPPTGLLEHGGTLTLGEHEFTVRHTPGHAPGHVIVVAEEAGFALVGDVVFLGSIGRTDLPGGDLSALIRSIRTEVLTLPDDLRLLPGHGPETTVGHERRHNPFLVPHYRGHFA